VSTYKCSPHTMRQMVEFFKLMNLSDLRQLRHSLETEITVKKQKHRSKV